MKKKMLITLIAIFAMLFAFGVASVSAATAIDNGSLGENLTWTLDNEGTLTINGTGEMYDFHSQGMPAPWIKYESDIISIKVNDGVTSISQNAFSNLGNANSISLPNTIETIGRNAFSYTAYYNDETNWESGVLYLDGFLLETTETISGEVVIKNGTKIIAAHAFKGRNNVTSIVIPDSVTYIDYWAFKNCSSLSVLTVGMGVTYIEDGAFGDCSSLKNVYWNAVQCENDEFATPFNNSGTNVEKMTVVFGNGVKVIPSNLFRGCSTLSDITIPATIEKVGKEAFYNTAYYNNENNWENGALYIDNVLIEGSNVQGEYVVKANTRVIADSAFKYAFNLTSISLPDSVVSIGKESFLLSNSLTNISLGNGLQNIGNRAFEQSSIEYINIPASVTDIGIAVFSICEDLVEINVSEDNEKYSSLDGVLYDKSKTTIIEYPSMKNSVEYIVPDSVKVISNNAFDYCKYLEKIVLPNELTTIGNAAFRCSYILSEINIPKTVNYIGEHAFNQCRSIKEIDIPYGVENIYLYTFSECTNLEKVTIPSTVSFIGHHAFATCSNLCDIDIPTTVNEIEWNAFSGSSYYYNDSNWDNGGLYIDNCLVSVKTTGNMDFVIKEGTRVITKKLFANDSNIKSITIPQSVITIPESAFEYCSNLTQVTFLEGLKHIGSSAFSDCSNIEKINLPTTLETIGERAFYGCSSVTSIVIPDSVSSIGYYAFVNASNVTELTLGKNLKYLSLAFSSSNIKKIYWDSKDLEMFCSYSFNGAGQNSGELDVVFGGTVEEIPYGAFSGNRYLKDITLGENITFISQHAFNNCTNLEHIYWNAKNVIDFKYNSPFSDYNSSESKLEIHFGNTVEKIPSYAFTSNKNVKKIYFSDSITQIGEYAFPQCSGITEIELPKNISYIPKNAFSFCSGLVKVTIPYSVSKIDNMAFIGCDNITDVYYNSTKKDWNKIVIGWGNDPILNANIHYFTISTKTELLEDGTFLVAPSNVPKNSSIVFVCYFDNRLSYVEIHTYNEESSVPFAPDKEYDSVKVMVWDNLTKLKPLCDVEIVK